MRKFIILSATLVASLFVNFLANYLPLNGFTTAEVSAKYFNYFTPAGYVFSIWGLIYGALILLFFAIGFDLKKYQKYLDKVFNWYIIVNLSNIAWIFSWHYLQLPLTVPFIVLMLISLVQIYLITKKEKGLSMIFKFTSSLYLGWLSVATLANLSAFFASMDYRSALLPETYMAVVMMFVALCFGMVMLLQERDFVFFGVIVWGIVGIILNFLNVPVIFIGGMTLLAITFAAIIFVLPKKKGKK